MASYYTPEIWVDLKTQITKDSKDNSQIPSSTYYLFRDLYRRRGYGSVGLEAGEVERATGKRRIPQFGTSSWRQ